VEPGTRGSFLEVINTGSPMWRTLEAGTRGHLKRLVPKGEADTRVPMLSLAA
jgi:hypothetical protein